MRYFLILILIMSNNVFAKDKTQEMRDTLDKVYGKHEIYETFYHDLVDRIIRGDSAAISKMNSYPLRTISNSGTVFIQSEKEFLENYDTVIDEGILNAVTHQSFSDLFLNSSGMMIGLGEIWFSGICVGTEKFKECDVIEIKVMTYNRKTK